jgi:hypothetical protein
MSTHNYDMRFELKPGKYVYIQRDDAAVRGRAAIKQIERRYKPHDMFFHLRRKGGHVAALRLHQKSAFFTRFDIQNFFGNVTRSKIFRALRQIGFPQKRAFNIAVDGVVVEGRKKVLPYGFCQSPILATLALEMSHLGSELKIWSGTGISISVYMDDVLVSCDDQKTLLDATNALVGAADLAGFPLSKDKLSVAVPEVESFNCCVKRGSVTVTDRRLNKFAADYQGASPAGRVAIEKYVETISITELSRLHALL